MEAIGYQLSYNMVRSLHQTNKGNNGNKAGAYRCVVLECCYHNYV